VFKTDILVVLTVKSGLGNSYTKDDDSCCVKILIVYCLMLYIIYVTLIMRLWDLYNLVTILVEFDMDSLLLFSPHPLGKGLGLSSTSQFGSCRVKLIPEVEVIFCCLLPKVISDLLCTLYIMHCLLILPLICSYMWDLTSKTHIWCISDFVLKIGYYIVVSKQC